MRAAGEMRRGDRGANNFDAVRLVAAALVIFSHAFLIADGNEDREPLVVLTGRECNLGVAAVFVFFTVSGYLVTQSWRADPAPLAFLARRTLRIFPGLFAATLVAAFLVGPLATSLPLHRYLADPEVPRYVVGNTLLDFAVNRLPGVLFADNPVGLEVNGALWTLRYEFQMYLLVIVLGTLGLLGRKSAIALVALGLALLAGLPLDLGTFGWLLAFFATGIALSFCPVRILGDGRLALAALLLLAAGVVLRQFILVFPLSGSVLALWAALTPRLPPLRAARFGDLSYGLYLYGWPMEQLVAHWSGGTAPWWGVAAGGLVGAAGFAFLSWHLVERPFLRLRPRPGTPGFAIAAALLHAPRAAPIRRLGED